MQIKHPFSKCKAGKAIGGMLILASALTYAGARAGALAEPQSYSASSVSQGGTVSGKILYNGKPIKPQRYPVTQDVSACGSSQEVYPVRIEQGGIAAAVIWLDDISGGKAFSFATPSIDQKKCEFIPHVMVMQPGTLNVQNSDPASHNIHVFSSANREINQVMPAKGSPVEVTLTHPDQVKMFCEIHKWMTAYIVVAKNPYYVVSGPGGSYSLGDIPPGKYHLKVWQESLGTQTKEITVEAGKTAEADFTLGSK